MISKFQRLRGGVWWIGTEIVRFFTAPLGSLGGFLDAVRGWKHSRQWIRFWFHLPAFLLLLGVYLVFAFSLFERVDGKVQRYGVAGERVLTTRELERVSFRNFKFMSPTDSANNKLNDSKAMDEFTRKYATLLANRVLSIQPENAQARYRLALIKSVEGRATEATQDMKELAEGDYGIFAPANAWHASWLVQAKDLGAPVDPQDLGKNLQLACEWNEVPVPLILLYAQLLEQNGYVPNAITMLKEATRRMPEMSLELARLYGRVKNEDGVREASYEVEDVFGARLNTSLERDADRLAIAEVRFLLGKNNQAISVLQEGITASNGTRPQLSRGLSSLKTAIFEKSISSDLNGRNTVDLSMLESAAETDPNDPKISEQITKLLRKGIKPNKKIIAILRKQMDAGVTTAESHSILAEGFYAQGNQKEAIKNWEIALEKNPSEVSACNNLALCLAKADLKNLPRSMELIERARRASPENAEVLDSYGEILLIAGQPKEAIGRLEQAIRIDSNRIATRKKLVQAYEGAGQRELARAQTEVINALQNQGPGID